jgi:hypothetical protein
LDAQEARTSPAKVGAWDVVDPGRIVLLGVYLKPRKSKVRPLLAVALEWTGAPLPMGR